MAQPEDEHGETDAVAEKADDTDRKQERRGWQARATGEREGQIDCPGYQALEHGDLHRIGRRLLRVRLLSIPQQRQAPAISSAPH